MTDPRPLFDDEDASRVPGALDLSDLRVPIPAQARGPGALDLSEPPMPSPLPAPPQRVVAVARLDLADTPGPPVRQARAGPPVRQARAPAPVIGIGEPAGLAQGMERGAAKFPAVMRDSGFLVRNCLGQLLPLGFDTLTLFGGETLQRAAALIGEMASLNARLREVDAEGILVRIVEAARTHAAHRRQVSFRGLLGELVPFDARAAEQQVGGVHGSLTLRLDQVAAAADALARLQTTLVVEVTTLAILGDMSDHGTMGDQLARRSMLFTTSLQEVATALAQAESLRRQVQDWTMRCDEVRTITLPALGYGGSF